jgi:hypothetical protein
MEIIGFILIGVIVYILHFMPVKKKPGAPWKYDKYGRRIR